MRRRPVRPSAAALVASSLTIALAGCGSDYDPATDGPQAKASARTSIAIDYASYYAPGEDLRRLTLAKAAERGANVRFSDDPSGAPAQLASLRRLTAAGSGFSVVAVAPFDPPGLAPITADAAARDVKIVSFVVPVPGQTAAITIDAGDAAQKLVNHAAAWAKRRPGPHSVLLVTPPPTSPTPDPFQPFARQTSAAVRTAVKAAGLNVQAEVSALGTSDAEEVVQAALTASKRPPDIVLTWNDPTATGAAAAKAARRRYVGATGAPAVSSAATLRQLARNGPLKAIAAPRLTDLATALVDVPLAILNKQPATTNIVPARLFTTNSPDTQRALKDYADG